jgi:hypothetical protein
MSLGTWKEEYRLACKQDGWNLAGGSSAVTSRTRNAGSGRPNMLIKRLPNEHSSESDNSDYEDIDLSEVSEHEDDEDDECEDDKADEEATTKPPATRLILEVQSKNIMEKNCRCPECKGPVEMEVNTLCLASNVMLCCKDVDCGYVDHSDLPASAKCGQSTDDRERITDYAVNVLYAKIGLSFLWRWRHRGCTSPRSTRSIK